MRVAEEASSSPAASCQPCLLSRTMALYSVKRVKRPAEKNPRRPLVVVYLATQGPALSRSSLARRPLRDPRMGKKACLDTSSRAPARFSVTPPMALVVKTRLHCLATTRLSLAVRANRKHRRHSRERPSMTRTTMRRAPMKSTRPCKRP